ncbi:MAG: glycosyltransferase family 39 protein [Gammaproteobacteria bacterium]|nr:MAG: glycosyltransferase family 39 protein [Gammaproteobacteria bacterium]
MNPSTTGLRWLLYLIAALLLLRLAGLGLYPLTDTTESRYAEIGREMVTGGDWVMPRLDPGRPFWAKPPLSAWLTASGMELFGINAFGARVMHWLAAVLTLLLTGLVALRLWGPRSAILAMAVLASTGLFVVLAGGVMTDPALGLASTLMLAGVVLALHERRRTWGYLAFLGAGLGLLAKGPIALVLAGLGVFLWLLWCGRWRAFFTSLPWLGGIALMLAVSVPWYIWAELRSPGFLHYFLIGEHFMRFVDPNWSGDLYGWTHSRPKGTIWLFWLLAALPWSLLLIAFLLRRRLRQALLGGDDLAALLLCWMLAPMLFFTLAGSVLPTYVYPGLPAMALLLGRGLDRADAAWLRRPAFLLPMVLAAPLLIGLGAPLLAERMRDEATQIPVLEVFFREAPADAVLAYAIRREGSAEFYGRGRTLRMHGADTAQWRQLLAGGHPVWVVIEHDNLNLLPPFLRPRVEQVARHGKFQLLRIRPETPKPASPRRQ